jgi:adenylosuccinate synthase
VIHKDCHLTFPFHQYLEKKLEEDKDPSKKVGTTGSGVCTTMAAMVLWSMGIEQSLLHL